MPSLLSVGARLASASKSISKSPSTKTPMDRLVTQIRRSICASDVACAIERAGGRSYLEIMAKYEDKNDWEHNAVKREVKKMKDQLVKAIVFGSNARKGRAKVVQRSRIG